uniref:Steroid dehydrogenase n=1 Tax=Timema douglasi TaxID=61478 RepID=A0A7R8VM29_TIMDO|nr:unnamed protein product [Timema douglasi]
MFTILEGVGLVCITVVGLQFCRIIYRITYNSIIGPFFKKNVDFTQYGRWAVITGATDGIGRAYAEALAKQGMDIVLISRNMSKLEAVSEALEKTHQVKTVIIEADFTDPSPTMYNHIEKELVVLKPPPIVLINNVGMSYPYPEYFLDLPDRDQRFMDIINCNILSVTNMCKMIIPNMFDNGKGVVINISSTAALIPSPMLTVYAASKVCFHIFPPYLTIHTGYACLLILVR